MRSSAPPKSQRHAIPSSGDTQTPGQGGLRGSHLHGQWVGRVNDGRLARASVDDQVAVVVGEHRNGQDFHPWRSNRQTYRHQGMTPPLPRKGGRGKPNSPHQVRSETCFGQFGDGNPSSPQSASVGGHGGATAGGVCGGGGSPGLTGEAAGLGCGVAVGVPLPGLLHLPLVEEIAQPRAGVQAVPGEGRPPPGVNPQPPPWSPPWGGGCCQGWDPHGGHIQRHFPTCGGWRWRIPRHPPQPPAPDLQRGQNRFPRQVPPSCSGQQEPGIEGMGGWGVGSIAAGVFICPAVCPGGLCSPGTAGAPGFCPQQRSGCRLSPASPRGGHAQG